MAQPHSSAKVNLVPLIRAWAILLMLTLFSIGLSRRGIDGRWLAVLVAAIVWIKGWLVARAFIESRNAIPFIRFLLNGFAALAPIALLLTGFLGREFARWTAL